MNFLSSLVQLLSEESDKWNKSPKLAGLLIRDKSTEGLMNYAGDVKERGKAMIGLLQGIEPTDAQKSLFNISNPGTEQGAMDMGMGFIGSIGKFGKLSPNVNFGGVFPDIKGVIKTPNQSTALASDNLNLGLRLLDDGTFQANYNPSWGSSSKGFSVKGDDASELLQASLNRINKSNKAIEVAKQRKLDNSLLGRLKAEYGDSFSTAKSTQSKSQYIIHNPSGTKIRISDHNLPLHYEQPDINLSNNMSVDDQFAAIRDYFK